MKDAILHMETHGTASQQQDIRKAKVALALHGIEAADFDTFAADLLEFDRRVPKLSGTMPGLQRLIHVAGISDNTYKQSWRAARRLISEFTGAAAEKKERKGRDDAWTELQRRVEALVSTGLLGSFSLRGLSSLTDACRVLRLAPTDLTSETVGTLLSVDGSHQRTTLRKGLKALDHTTETGFLKATFDIWLAEGSAEIGLPLSSHNFRHGYCSIAINESRVSMEDLAKIMGDTVAVVRRNYAWIDGKASVLAVQKITARRRAEAAQTWKGAER